MIPSFNSIDELQLYLFQQLKEEGEMVTARGFNTIEINNVAIRLKNIRKRCTTLNSRKWNLNFAIGEFAWHLSASNKLDAIEYYAKEWKNSSPDGQGIYESCYGHKIFKSEPGQSSQWQKIINLLRHDPYTRRAVLTLYNFNNVLELDSKDVACTCSIQFLFRNGKLDATVYMRSNDIIWGLPNDIFFFTMLQELLANELSVKVGVYNHMVGSLHVYERHFELAESILQKNTLSQYSDFEMPLMADSQQIETFLTYEERIRKGLFKSSEEFKNVDVTAYWKELLEVLLIQKLNLTHKAFPDNRYLSLRRSCGNTRNSIIHA